MGLKDLLQEQMKKEQDAREEQMKKAQETRQKERLDAVHVRPHPLREQGASLLDDYVLGQLIVRSEVPPQDNTDELMLFFRKSLGWTKEHFDEISLTASLYDDQAKFEHLNKLANILRKEEEIDCFLCDVALLHGTEYAFEGEVLDLWKSLSFGVFHLDEKRVAGLENFCKCLADCKRPQSVKKHGNVSKNVIEYCHENRRVLLSLENSGASADVKGMYMVISLAGGRNAKVYPYRFTNSLPVVKKDVCRTTELWLRRIPAGTFMMGSSSDESGRIDRETLHSVTLTQDFYIGIFPVTQRQWELVMGSNPSHNCYSFVKGYYPVEEVSYNNICGCNRNWPSDSSVSAVSFLGRLRRKTQLEGLDLPTEAQWEYACRAGTMTALNNGMDLDNKNGRSRNLGLLGWYEKNSGGWTNPVGKKQPNAWGLYDMHGNVWEWCRDWNGDYPLDGAMDPIGASTGSSRVIRGGSYDCEAGDCCAASCGAFSPEEHDCDLGFRLVFCAGNGDNGNQIIGEGRATDVKYGAEEGKVSESRTGIMSRRPPKDSKQLPQKKMSTKK